MIFVVLLFSILLVYVGAGALCEAPRDARDVICFLSMLAFCVIVILVLIVKGV